MDELRIVRERRKGYGQCRVARDPKAVVEAFKDHFQSLDREQVIAIVLDTKNHIQGFHVVSTGSLDSSIVHPREVYKIAVLSNASAIILVHNHPSGDPTPSPEDVSLTRRLKQAGDILGIKLLDHIVIGDDTYVSICEKYGLD